MARFLAAVCFGWFQCSHGNSYSAARSSLAQRVIERLQPLLDEQALLLNTSVTVGIASATETFGLAAGVQDHSSGAKATVDSRIPTGSATKLYTSVAVLQLAEKGVIDLDAPVAPVVDPFLKRTNGTTLLGLWGDTRVNAITARHLLSMRSGLDDYNDSLVRARSTDIASGATEISPYGFLHAYAPKTLLFSPGEGGAYSSIGYVLLGFLLAAATNATSWTDYDQVSILPDGLRREALTFRFPLRGPCSKYEGIVHQYATKASNRESPYWQTADTFDIIDASCLNGWTMGNLASSSMDMARVMYHIFGKASSPRLLSQESLAQMLDFRPFTYGFAVGMPYGLGIMNASASVPGVDPDYLQFIGHPGEDYGSQVPLQHYNGKMDLAIVMGMNSLVGLNCTLLETEVVADIKGPEIVSDCVLCVVIQEMNRTAWPGDCPCKLPSVAKTSDGPALQSVWKNWKAKRGKDFNLYSPHVVKVGRGAGGQELHCPSSGCTGASESLSFLECAAWKELHASTLGWKWRVCKDSWSDPCSCPGVRCSADGHVTSIALPLNGMVGRLPPSLGQATWLESLDLSGNYLFGNVPVELAGIEGLTTLRLNNNMLSSKLPALNFRQYVGGCGISGNDFDCPLPKDATSCRSAVEPVPTCDDFLSQLTWPCRLAVLRLYSNPGVVQYLSEIPAVSSALSAQAAKGCFTELVTNHTCHGALNWTSAASWVSGFAAAAKAVDKSAELCYVNMDQKQQCEGVGDCELVFEKASLSPLPGWCSAKDRERILEYDGRPSQCIQNSFGTSCKYSFSDSRCRGREGDIITGEQLYV